MRKYLFVSSLLLLFILAACGSSGVSSTPSPTSTAVARVQPGTEVPERPRVTPTAKPKPPTPTPTPTMKPGPVNTPTPGSTDGGDNGSNKGSSTPPPTTSSSNEQLARQLFALINQDRAANGLPALAWEPKLAVSAQRHNQVMMSGCGLSHQCSGEAGLGDRETNAGVSWNYCGENIGTGGPVATYDAQWSMASGLHRSMMNEKAPNDGHRRNLLSRDFHRIGISISIDARNHLWLTEDFAN